MRTASRLNSSLCIAVIFGLLDGEYCSQKTRTKPVQVQTAPNPVAAKPDGPVRRRQVVHQYLVPKLFDISLKSHPGVDIEVREHRPQQSRCELSLSADFNLSREIAARAVFARNANAVRPPFDYASGDTRRSEQQCHANHEGSEKFGIFDHFRGPFQGFSDAVAVKAPTAAGAITPFNFRCRFVPIYIPQQECLRPCPHRTYRRPCR